MAISFDIQNLDRARETDSAHLDAAMPDVCGAGLDWSRGIAGLSRSGQNPASERLLTKVIEGEIIPRLLLAHRQAPTNTDIDAFRGPLEGTTCSAFAELVLHSESGEIFEKVESLLARGITTESILLDLLAPVARMLGVFWEEDRCTFADVTIGVARLHQVLHELSRRERLGSDPVRLSKRAYFIPAPGDEHTFGLSVLEEFFLHAGWETATDYRASPATILKTAASQDLDVVGFSLACEQFLDPLCDLVKKTRAVSRNRGVTILVGGGLFLGRPDLANRIAGATIVSDSVHAVRVADAARSTAARTQRVEKPA